MKMTHRQLYESLKDSIWYPLEHRYLEFLRDFYYNACDYTGKVSLETPCLRIDGIQILTTALEVHRQASLWKWEKKVIVTLIKLSTGDVSNE